MAKKERICKHVKVDGKFCGSPVLSNRDYCYFHYRHRLRERHRIRLGSLHDNGIELPALEDRNSIQVAITEVMNALIDDRIQEKRASILLYGLQLSVSNLAGNEINENSSYIAFTVPDDPEPPAAPPVLALPLAPPSSERSSTTETSS